VYVWQYDLVDLVPDRKDNLTSNGIFDGQQAIELLAGPALGQEVRTKNHDAKATIGQTFVDFLVEAVPDSKLLAVEPNAQPGAEGLLRVEQ